MTKGPYSSFSQLDPCKPYWEQYNFSIPLVFWSSGQWLAQDQVLLEDVPFSFDNTLDIKGLGVVSSTKSDGIRIAIASFFLWFCSSILPLHSLWGTFPVQCRLPSHGLLYTPFTGISFWGWSLVFHSHSFFYMFFSACKIVQTGHCISNVDGDGSWHVNKSFPHSV